MSEWGTQVTARIAEQIRHYRGERSGQWLADRTKALGHPISKTMLWDIEQGKRKSIGVPDLLVLARALEVPPTLLLFPSPPDTEVEFLPGEALPAALAEQWFTGEIQVASPEPEEQGEPSHGVFGATSLPRYSHALVNARYKWAQEERGAQLAAERGATQEEMQARLNLAELAVTHHRGVVRDDWLDLGYPRPEELR
jgi:transcriptional regulator with XRE-family HTH domain